MKKYFVLLLTVVAVLGFSLTNTMAYPQFGTDQINDIYYHNAENWIDINSDQQISVGDYFYGILHVQNIDGRLSGTVWNEDNVAPGFDTFTGYFLTDVTAVSMHGDQPHITLGTYTGVADPNSVLTNAEIANGVVLKMWTDTFSKWTENTTIAGDIANSTDGTAWATFTADGGYWYTHAPLIPPSTAGNLVGESYLGLNIVDNFTGRSFGTVDDLNENEINALVNMAGQSEIEVPQTTYQGQWPFFSNDPVFVEEIAVPEPGTVLLLGSGLLGLGFFTRRKIKK